MRNEGFGLRVCFSLEPEVKQGNPNNAKPGDQAADKANQVPELSAELVAAWKKAGAQVGWMSADRLDRFFRQEKEGKKGEVPAFRFSEWPAGVVAKLPQPQTPFSLVIESSMFFGGQCTNSLPN